MQSAAAQSSSLPCGAQIRQQPARRARRHRPGASQLVAARRLLVLPSAPGAARHQPLLSSRAAAHRARRQRVLQLCEHDGEREQQPQEYCAPCSHRPKSKSFACAPRPRQPEQLSPLFDAQRDPSERLPHQSVREWKRRESSVQSVRGETLSDACCHLLLQISTISAAAAAAATRQLLLHASILLETQN